MATLPGAPATADLLVPVSSGDRVSFDPWTLPVPAFAMPPAAPAGVRTYDGVLTTTIRDFDRCGEPPADKTLAVLSQLAIGPPVSSEPAEPGFPPAVGEDTNPISLLLEPGGDAGDPGALNLASAARFAGVSPPLVLRFWGLRLEGEVLSGRLEAGHRAEAAALNLLADVVTLDPCRPFLGEFPNELAIAEGAELSGTLGADGADISVRGSTQDQTRLFTARFAGAPG